MSRFLCAVSDIPDPGALGFGDGGTSSLFAVRRDGNVHVYRNRCPHAHAPLNWMPNRFLTQDKRHIICSAHGAVFEIDSGACIAGPCPGQSLDRIASEIHSGEVWLLSPDEEQS